jgi:hypothetical protein
MVSKPAQQAYRFCLTEGVLDDSHVIYAPISDVIGDTPTETMGVGWMGQWCSHLGAFI